MNFFRLAPGGVVLLLGLLCLSGCLPTGDSKLDEQKEPHFLAGKRLATSLDYQGAISEYEKALRVNPSSASAHFELAYLFEEKAQEPDPAAAIYHYEKFLALAPRSEMADRAKAHMNSCKVELAKSISVLPATPGFQRDMEKLILENKELKAQLAQWQAYVAALRTHTPTSNIPAATTTAAVAVVPPAAQDARVASQAAVTQRPETVRTPTPTPTPPPASPASRTAPVQRTHAVRPGEAPYTIAKKYGVSLNSLLAANPGLVPTRMQVGQVLNIPSQ